MVGRQLGPFQIEAEIATWESGAVYRAQRKDKTVALRTFVSEDAAARKRFLAFAQSACKLNSPQIADTFGGGETGDTAFVTQAFVYGTSLSAMLQSGHSFSPFELLDVARQVCSALDHAAAFKVAHPRLTPANVVLEMDGTVKVLDYGVMRTGPPAGNALAYAAPEVLAGASPDARSNLYSWSAILLHMAGGSPPFVADSDEAMRSKIENDPPNAAILTGGRFEALIPILLQGMAKDPALRPESGKEFLQDIERALTHKPVMAPKVPVVAAAPPEKPAAARPVVERPPDPRPQPAALATPVVPHAAPAASAPEPVAKPVTQVNPPFVIRGRAEKSSGSVLLGIPREKLLLGVAGALAVAVIALLAMILMRKEPSPAATATPAPAAEAQPVQQPESAAQPVTEPVKPSAAGPKRAARKVEPAPAAAPAAPVVGSLVINTNPENAGVRISGRDQVFRSPVSLNDLTPGQYMVTVTAAGHRNQTQSIEVTAGRQAIMAVSLTPLELIAQATSEPPGAAIFVGGRDTGKVTPAEVTLQAGPQVLLLRRAGYLDAATSAQAQPGVPFKYHATLQATGDVSKIRSAKRLAKIFGGGAPAGMGTLVVKTTPKGAQVRVNGQAVDDSPSELFLPPGSYEVVLALSGFRSERRVVRIEVKGKQTYEVTLQPER